MSVFPRFSRKAALLLAKLGEQGFTDGNQRLEVLGGRTLNALRNWRQRRSNADYRDSQGVSDKLKSSFVIDDPRDLLSDVVTVQEFAAFIGYSRQHARRIIDQAYAELFPTYTVFYSPERAALDLLDRFSGMHFIYRMDRNNALTHYTGQDKNILRIPLAVRYIMKAARPANADFYRVRCKLTIPSYTAPSACFEYDGYVTTQKHNTHYWFFENRSEENKDLLLMITDSLSVLRLRDDADNALREHWFAEGVMLTRRQDDWPIHKIWKVVVVRVPSSSAGEGDPEAAMSDQCSIISQDEVPVWIRERLSRGWSGLDLSSFSL